MGKKIVVIHGPNLNMLGTREPEQYGTATLSEINEAIQKKAAAHNAEMQAFQSNHEGEIIDTIQKAASACDALIINPGAYTHTSIAIRDALVLLDIPVIEVHLSNIYKREAFRHHSMIAGSATGQISGLGMQGYLLAVEACIHLIRE